MKRKVFFSFHFKNDFARVQQVRNMGMTEANPPVTANQWETIQRQGDAAIRKWINENMHGKSCLVVLVGSQTYSRKWVKYEIKTAWEGGRGVLGIHINKLKDLSGNISEKGPSPFQNVSIIKNSKQYLLGTAPPLITPTGRTSTETYAAISKNLENWIEDAIRIRKEY